jgi:outer membrane protein
MEESMRQTALLSLLLMWMAPAPALAEGITLTDALRQGVANRPLTQAARHDTEAMAAEAEGARSRFLPRITLSERFTWTDEPAAGVFMRLNQQRLTMDDMFSTDPPARRNFETRLTVEQSLFDADLRYGMQRARQGVAAASAKQRWSEEEAAMDVFRAYLRVQQAQATGTWVAAARQQAEEILRLGEERYQAGSGLRTDVLRAKVFLAETQRMALTADHDLSIARRSLALAIGWPQGEAAIAGPLEAGLLTTAAQMTPQLRADVRALDAQVSEAQLALRQSRAAWLPKLGISGSYSLHHPDHPFGEARHWALGAGLTWDLYEGGGRGHQQSAAAARLAAQQARRSEAQRGADFRSAEARLRAQEASLQLETARAAVVEAEESQRLIALRFAEGISDLSELLSVQTALDRVRLDAILAESGYLLALGEQLMADGNFLTLLLPEAAEEGQP